MHFTLVPAYGRDYKSKKAILADLLAGKDFQDESFGTRGGYINLEEILPVDPTNSGTTINVRYSQLRKVAVFKGADLKQAINDDENPFARDPITGKRKTALPGLPTRRK